MQDTAPSGLTANVRKIKGHVLASLAAEADADTSADGGISTIVGGCWESTVEAGPYAFVTPGEGIPDWSRVLKGDLMFWLLRLRALSVRTPDSNPGPWGQGDAYCFPVKCQNCPKQYDWEVNLSSLPIKHLPEESAQRIRSGDGRFKVTVGGRAYVYELQMPKHDEPMRRARKQQKRVASTIIDVLTSQTVSIEGVKPSIIDRYNHMADLEFEDIQALQEAYEASDCGVETSLDTKCPGCRWVQEVELPLGKGFFAPRRRSKEPIEETDSPSPSTVTSFVTSSGESAPSGGTSSSAT